MLKDKDMEGSMLQPAFVIERVVKDVQPDKSTSRVIASREQAAARVKEMEERRRELWERLLEQFSDLSEFWRLGIELPLLRARERELQDQWEQRTIAAAHPQIKALQADIQREISFRANQRTTMRLPGAGGSEAELNRTESEIAALSELKKEADRLPFEKLDAALAKVEQIRERMQEATRGTVNLETAGV